MSDFRSLPKGIRIYLKCWIKENRQTYIDMFGDTSISLLTKPQLHRLFYVSALSDFERDFWVINN